MKRELIKTIKIDAANLEYIAKTGNINGTLLIEIERVMDEYVKQANGQQSEQRQLTIPDVNRIVCSLCKDTGWYFISHFGGGGHMERCSCNCG